MAHDKRHPMSTDMNDIDLNDASAMTDKERASLQMGLSESEQSGERKKAM